MKNLFICLVLAASLSFSGCGGKGVTTPIDPPVDPPVVPPTEYSRAWTGIIALRETINYKDNISNLWLVTPTGAKKVSENLHDWERIAWSPDGQYLSCQIKGTGGLVCVGIMDKNGNNTFKGENSFYFDNGSFMWKSDSSALVYGEYFDGIYAVNPTGSISKKMTSNSATYDHCVTPSFYDDYIYWIHHEYNYSATLYRVTRTQFDSGFSFASAEKVYSFTTDDDEAVKLYPLSSDKILMIYTDAVEIVNPNTKTSINVTDKFDSSFNQVRVSPNGKFIAYTSYSKICIMDVQTLTLTKTISDLWLDTFSWSPDSNGLVYFDDYIAKVMVYWLDVDKTQTIYTFTKPAKSTRTHYEDMGTSLSWTK